MASVYANKSKKDGKVLSYYTVAYIGELDDGRPFQKKITIKVSDLPPGSPTTPAAQKKAAADELDRIAREMREAFQSTHSTEDRNQITLAEFIEKHWWPDKVMNGHKSPNTIQFYKDQKAQILAYFNHGEKLPAIDTQAIIRFNNYQRSKAKKENGEPISQSTAAHRYATLRAILQYAYRIKYLRENPVENLEDDEKVVQEKHEVFHLTESEIKAFEDMLAQYTEDSGSKYWEVYFLIALRCGLRRGEIIPLQWKDITEDADGNATIKVEKNAVRNPDADGKMEIRKPKREKSRSVPVPKMLYQLIKEYKAEQTEFGFSTLPAAYIFPRESDPSTCMYPTTPTKRLRKLEEKYCVTTASVHDLRHTAGSVLASKGTPLKVIQMLLGHSSIQVTGNYYVGTDEEQMRQAVNAGERIG